MRQIAPLLVVICIAIIPATAAEPSFTFVESRLTGKHIAVQPKEEHHRIYFPLRIKECAGKMVFARVRCLPSDGTVSVSTVHFEIRKDNELWQVYLRAPRHPDRNATYQVEIGYTDPSKLEEYQVLNSYAWHVRRDGKGPQFVTEDILSNGERRPVTLPLVVREAVLVGGKFTIILKTMMAGHYSDPNFKFGLDDSGRAISYDGSGAEKVAD